MLALLSKSLSDVMCLTSSLTNDYITGNDQVLLSIGTVPYLSVDTSAKVQIDYRLRYAYTRTRAAHSKLPVDPCATRSL